MRIVVLSAVFAAAVCSVALAEPSNVQPTSPTTASAASQVRNPQEVVCKDRVATGSRLAYARDCHTRAEWESIARDAQDYAQGIQLHGFNLNNCPVGTGKCGN
jgi:hypothetical protein